MIFTSYFIDYFNAAFFYLYVVTDDDYNMSILFISLYFLVLYYDLMAFFNFLKSKKPASLSTSTPSLKYRRVGKENT